MKLSLGTGGQRQHEHEPSGQGFPKLGQLPPHFDDRMKALDRWMVHGVIGEFEIMPDGGAAGNDPARRNLWTHDNPWHAARDVFDSPPVLARYRELLEQVLRLPKAPEGALGFDTYRLAQRLGMDTRGSVEPALLTAAMFVAGRVTNIMSGVIWTDVDQSLRGEVPAAPPIVVRPDAEELRTAILRLQGILDSLEGWQPPAEGDREAA